MRHPALSNVPIKKIKIKIFFFLFLLLTNFGFCMGILSFSSLRASYTAPHSVREPNKVP